MSSETLRLVIAQKEIDDDENESNLVDYTISESFSDRKATTFKLPSANIWYNVEFDQIDNSTGATLMRIDSSDNLTVKLNQSSTEMENVEDVIWKGKITDIKLKNNSGNQATITVELFE